MANSKVNKIGGIMPQVGKKKFPYTKKGMSMAEAYAKASGKKTKSKKKAPSMKKMKAEEAMQQRGYKGTGGR